MKYYVITTEQLHADEGFSEYATKSDGMTKKQAQKAASHRVKSEAETRYLIDEQLRKVGWEADTETLRYSKGTRPEKGRCRLHLLQMVVPI